MARRTRYAACLSRNMKGSKGTARSRMRKAHRACRGARKKK